MTRFGIMLPYRIAKPNKEYADDIRALVAYLRNAGIKVIDLKDTDILDKNDKPVEHVYIYWNALVKQRLPLIFLAILLRVTMEKPCCMLNQI